MWKFNPPPGFVLALVAILSALVAIIGYQRWQEGQLRANHKWLRALLREE